MKNWDRERTNTLFKSKQEICLRDGLNQRGWFRYTSGNSQLLITCKTSNPGNVMVLTRVLTILTSKSAMLRTSRSNKIKRDVRRATDILMWKGAVGPGIALTHHSLANKVHSSHDKKGKYYSNDGTDGTAVGLRFIRGWLWFFWKRGGKRRTSLNTAIYKMLSWSLHSTSVSSVIYIVPLQVTAFYSDMSNYIGSDYKISCALFPRVQIKQKQHLSV